MNETFRSQFDSFCRRYWPDDRKSRLDSLWLTMPSCSLTFFPHTKVRGITSHHNPMIDRVIDLYYKNNWINSSSFFPSFLLLFFKCMKKIETNITIYTYIFLLFLFYSSKKCRNYIFYCIYMIRDLHPISYCNITKTIKFGNAQKIIFKYFL